MGEKSRDANRAQSKAGRKPIHPSWKQEQQGDSQGGGQVTASVPDDEKPFRSTDPEEEGRGGPDL